MSDLDPVKGFLGLRKKRVGVFNPCVPPSLKFNYERKIMEKENIEVRVEPNKNYKILIPKKDNITSQQFDIKTKKIAKLYEELGFKVKAKRVEI